MHDFAYLGQCRSRQPAVGMNTIACLINRYSLLFWLGIWGFVSPNSVALSFDVDLSEHYNADDWKFESQVTIRDNDGAPTAVLILKIKNVSDHAAGFRERNIMLDFAVHLFEKSGIEVALTELGKTLLEKEYRTTTPRAIEPGTAATYELKLKDYFQLASGKTYRITARRYLSNFLIPRNERMRSETNVRLIYIDSEPVSFQCP